jgi:hypothetical protein
VDSAFLVDVDIANEIHVYGPSTRNQRTSGLLHSLISNETHKECLWFCLHGIIQQALDEMKHLKEGSFTF